MSPVRNKCSSKWSDAVCQEKLRAGNYSESDVSTTDVVSYRKGERSIISCREDAGSERPDANSLRCGAGGHDHVLLSIEVNELSWMAQTGMSVLDENACPAFFFINMNISSLLFESMNDLPEMQSIIDGIY